MFKETVNIFTMCLISILWEAGSTVGDKVCDPITIMKGPHRYGICGRRIDEMLEDICPFGTNSRLKRDTTNIPDKETSSELNTKLNKVLLNKEDANTYLVKKSEYGQSGIVCECCFHQCHYSELLSYCAPHPDDMFDWFLRIRR